MFAPVLVDGEPLSLGEPSLDGEGVTASTVNATHFDRDAISISGSFDEAEALALAIQISASARTGLELFSISVSR
jgi:hypothetical protein